MDGAASIVIIYILDKRERTRNKSRRLSHLSIQTWWKRQNEGIVLLI